MTFYLNDFFIVVEVNYLDEPHLLVWDSQHTRVLSRGKVYDTFRVVASHKSVSAVQLLEVVHIYFINKDNYNFVFSELAR